MDKRVRISARAAYVASPGRVALLNLTDPMTAEPLILTDTGAAIWEAIAAAESGTTVGAVAEELADAYEVLPAQILPDIQKFADQLEQSGLLVREG